MADEVLKKREAERERQQVAEQSEDEGSPPAPNRRGSISSESVSTISTNASKDSRSPRRRSRSPVAQTRRRSPDVDDNEAREPLETSLGGSSHSTKQARRSHSRDSLSPINEAQKRHYRDRESSGDEERRPRRSRRESPPRHEAKESRRRISYASQSPQPEGRRPPLDQDQRSRHHNRDEVREQRPPRQRSLSPFSRRLAMTQSMNRGNR